MSRPIFLSISDQVAAHLRAEIARGRWSGTLPGKHQLAASLGVNNKTVEVALHQLEHAGVLIGQGTGRVRRIARSQIGVARRLRIACLPASESDSNHLMDYDLEYKHGLAEAGHTMVDCPKPKPGLWYDLNRIKRLVRRMKVEAWIIWAGSRPVLEWFSSQEFPSLAIFGQRAGLNIASVGPDKSKPMAEATRHLLQLGHRRIVLLVRKLRRLPEPGVPERAFLAELASGGVKPGAYNLPDWQETPSGFQALLESLFQVTPPTAIIADEASYFVATMQFLLRRGIRMPEEVSLTCTDDDLAFVNCHPPVTRIAWDSRPLVHRVLQWANHVSRGIPDKRASSFPARFIPGGTTGPAPRS